MDIPWLTIAVAGVILLLCFTWSQRLPAAPTYTLQVQNFERDVVYLFGFTDDPKMAWGSPDLSPFVIKLEAFLRYAKIKYVKKSGFKPGPKGKWPYIELNGQVYSDTALIIDVLCRKFDIDLDGHLSPQERALHLALTRLCEEHLYWFGVVHHRWLTPQGWAMIKPIYFYKIPGLLRNFVANRLVRPPMYQAAWAQGVARYTQQEVTKFALDDLYALSTLLGESVCFGGHDLSRLCSLDLAVFGQLEALIGSAPVDCELIREAKEIENLNYYVRRVKAKLFSELVMIR
eukprot:g16592.t1